MNVTAIWHTITEILKPAVKHSLTTEQADTVDQSINMIAPDRIRRSPGMQNIAEVDNEPDWFQE